MNCFTIAAFYWVISRIWL